MEWETIQINDLSAAHFNESHFSTSFVDPTILIIFLVKQHFCHILSCLVSIVTQITECGWLFSVCLLPSPWTSSSWECIVLCCCCCRDHQSLGGIETKKFASKWNVSLLLWNFHWLHIHDILHGAGRTTQCCAGYLVTLHSSSSPHWLWLMLRVPACHSAPLLPHYDQFVLRGAKSRLEMAPCEHWELLAAASPPFLHFPSFSQSGAGMGRH